MYIAISNVFYAGIIWGYYIFVKGEREKFLPGIIMATACYLAGILLGFALTQEKKPRPRILTRPAKARLPDFDNIAD
jgi:hypothetical protein